MAEQTTTHAADAPRPLDSASGADERGVSSPTFDPRSGSGGRRGVLATLGAVGGSLLASLCCIGPLLYVALGVGAGLATTFEPLRPAFTIIALALLAFRFYQVYGRRRAVTADAASGACGQCAAPRRTRDQVVLWAVAVVTLALLTFPQWSKLLV